MTDAALLLLAGCLAAACGACSTTPARTSSSLTQEPSGDPAIDPAASGIEHVVLVMMENRSFDHLLGWAPGADGRQAGVSYPARTGASQATHALAPDFQGCGHADPDHSYEGGRVEYDAGACDGWLRAGANDLFSIGYYRQSDLSFFGRAVSQGTVLDRYFAAIMAETYPNRIYQHAGQTDRISNNLSISTLPTIWDRLAEKGLTGRYYYSDVPFLALWGDRYLSIARPVAAFVVEALSGQLPQVSYVDARFIDDKSGTSGDDHPHSDIRNGEAFLNQIYSVVTRGPAWKSTVLVINYDEWGGFFDHVPPPTAPIPAADQAAGNRDGRLGFRTPAMVFAPWAAAGAVSHVPFDHTSVLRMIEWRWGLAPLTARDAAANNLALALDFTKTRPRPPVFLVPPGPFGVPCPEALPAPVPEVGLGDLLSLARQFRWSVLHTPDVFAPLLPQ